MEFAEKILIQILTSYLHHKPLMVNLAEMDKETWKRFVLLAEIHGLSGICYQVLKKEESCPEQMLNIFSRQFKFIAAQSISNEVEMQRFSAVMEQANIQHLFFKGWELKNYYPIPETRTMSDVDFLIQKKDADRASKTLMRAGFQLVSTGSDVIILHRNSLHLEMHFELGTPLTSDQKSRTILDSAFSHGIFENGKSEGYFDHEYHFVLLLLHIATHMQVLGAGIRMYYDVAIFWKQFSEELNMNRVWNMIRDLHMETFSQSVFGLCKRWFDLEIPGACDVNDALYHQLCDYILGGGVYGKFNRSMTDYYARKSINEQNLSDEKSQKIMRYVRYFFPGRKEMAGFLPSVERFPILLPVAWVMRWYKGLFYRKKHSLQVIKGFKDGGKNAKEEYLMLKELGLW